MLSSIIAIYRTEREPFNKRTGVATGGTLPIIYMYTIDCARSTLNELSRD